MTEDVRDTEWIRSEAAFLADMIKSGAEGISPRTAGFLGYLLMSLPATSAGDVTADLDHALILLHYGVKCAPADPCASPWRLAVAAGIAHRAETSGDLADWDRALHWAEEAADTAATVEERHDAIEEVISIAVGRLMELANDESRSEEQELAELADVLACIEQRRPELADPITQTALDVQVGRLLAARYDLTAKDADRMEAIRLLERALPLLPDGDLDLPGGHALLAELYYRQFGRTENPLDLGKARIAAARGAELSPETDPGRPGRHMLLVTIIDRMHPDGLGGEARNEVIKHLEIAATGEADPATVNWLGFELLDRGRERSSSEDVDEAIRYFSRVAEQDGTASEDGRLALATLIDIHQWLLDNTGDHHHVHAILEMTTRALESASLEPDFACELHFRRLSTLINDHVRPDFMEFADKQVLYGWLGQAGASFTAASMTTPGPGAEVVKLLPLTALYAWFQLGISGGSQLFETMSDLATFVEPISWMIDAPEADIELEESELQLLESIKELAINIRHLAHNRGDAEFVKLTRILSDSEYSEFHKDFTLLLAILLFSAGSSNSSLNALDSGLDILNSIQAENDLQQQEKSVLNHLFRLVRAHLTRDSAQRQYALARRAWKEFDKLPRESAMSGMAKLFDKLVRPISLTQGHKLPELTPTTKAGQEKSNSTPLDFINFFGRISLAAKTRNHSDLKDVCHQLDRLAEETVDNFSLTIIHSAQGAAYRELAKMNSFPEEATEKAIQASTKAIETMEIDGSTLVEFEIETLAGLVRQRDAAGDRAESRRLGRKLLINSGWRVLLQADSERALEIAVASTPQADQLAAWCLADNVAAELVEMVDARRSLVLRAANLDRSVAERLRQCGQLELADQWVRSGGVDEELYTSPDGNLLENWGGLRGRILRALAASSDKEFEPITVDELRRSLNRTGSQVIVYLLPENNSHGGAAAFVPSAGPPEILLLPELRSSGPLETYQAAYRAWDEANDKGGREFDTWRAELDNICRWAWGAAAARILGYARQLAGDRDPKIVLVPVGPLGVVPWHAAYRGVGTSRRHLIQDATITYAPSGRLFCEVTERPHVAEGTELLVGNPAQNLAPAGTEAKALRDTLYESGVFLGGTGQLPLRWSVSSAGAGTPAQVLERLSGPVRLLHLACHARAHMKHPLHSSIQLAGEADEGRTTEDLSAKRLLRLSRTKPLELALVVLAGCATDVTGSAYDEALSLSTTFLAIGARTVVGSLWRVPSGWATAYLMFTFHYNLSQLGLPPAEALRRAQLALLDSGSEIPEHIPAELVRMRRNTSTTSLESWAAFTLQGL